MTKTKNHSTQPTANVGVGVGLGLALAFGLVLVGCGASTPGAHPDDMSAQHHRHMATMEQENASAHDAKFDPNAEQTSGVASSIDYDFGLAVYNPTAQHKREADKHREHADDHLAAAKVLESYEDAECGSFPPQSRAACPLLGPVVAAENIPNGVRLRFAEDTNLDAVKAHVRCHLAYARTQGYEGMDHCPLYIKGAESASTAPNTLDLTVSDPTLLDGLRQRAAEHVAH